VVFTLDRRSKEKLNAAVSAQVYDWEIWTGSSRYCFDNSGVYYIYPQCNTFIYTFAVYIILRFWIDHLSDALAQYPAPQSGKRQVHTLLVANKNENKETNTKNKGQKKIQVL